MLINAGAKSNLQDGHGETPLHRAGLSNEKEISDPHNTLRVALCARERAPH